MFPIYAKSPCALHTKLRDIDVRVPREGRTTAHSETWVSCHFLVAVSETNLLGYPLSITSGDRPDLVLSSPSERTGIEITRAAPLNQARVDVYAERNNIPCVLGYHYEPGEEKFPQQKIKAIAEGRIHSPPWMGDQIERNWVKAILYHTRRKADKFTQPGFAKYDRNWLLVYDNWSPSAYLDTYADATKDLGGKLFNCDWSNPFGRVFILRSHHVWKFSCGADTVKHAISDLWHAS